MTVRICGTARRRPLERLFPDMAMDHQLSAIRVETERLVLRVLTLDDFDDYSKVCADPGTFRFSERDSGMSGSEAWSRLLRQVGHWTLLGYGFFAVEEKASGRFAGEAGLGDFRRGLGPAFDGVPEAGWTIAPWAQGQGYATEAVSAALDWMEARFGTERTVCLVHVENSVSLHLAAKLGYVPFGTCEYRGYPGLMHERIWRRVAGS